MPTNYTGDPVGSNPPSPVPGPENYPILAMPLGPEGRTVSSVLQFAKTLADHIAWLKKPFGNTTIGQRYLQRWRTAVGHTRFAIDRMGLPAGTYLQMQERWAQTSGLAGNPTGFVPNYPSNWQSVASAGANGGVVFTSAAASGGVGVPNTRTGILRIAGGPVLGEFFGLQGLAMCAFHDDADITWETIITAEDSTSVTKPDLMAGFTETCYLADPRTLAGVYFWRDITKPNWQAVCRDSGAETIVDTGFAVSGGAALRARIEYRGANVNDGGVRAAYFFLGQIPVATITTNVPVTGSAAALFLVKNTHGTVILRTGPSDLYVGPVNMACNLMPSVTT